MALVATGIHAPCGPVPCDAFSYGGKGRIFDAILSQDDALGSGAESTLSCEARLVEARNALHQMMVLGKPAMVVTPSGTTQFMRPSTQHIQSLQGYIRQLESECGARKECPDGPFQPIF